MFKLTCIVEGKEGDLVENKNLQLLTLAPDLSAYEQLKSQEFDLAVLASDYEAIELMDSLELSYLLMDGFDASDLKLPYESSVHRHTLIFDVTETFEELAHQSAKYYKNMMI